MPRMHPHAELLERFYTAFQKRDGDTMAGFYAPDARFSDPVFTDLKGDEPGSMWRMLCSRSKDLALDFEVLQVDDSQGKVRWVARYTFTKTGRPVENHVTSQFAFKDGKIATQRDTFDFWRWSRMALGLSGMLLGWTPIVKNAVRREAARGLAAFRNGR
jgi:ketosteroid isomerase-like protein